MKKLIFFTLLVSTFFQLKAQQNVIKDTIYIGKDYNSHLVFDAPIELANYGAEVVAANGEGQPMIQDINNTSVIILKADKKFKGYTNVSVITKTNKYYNLIVLYTENPKTNFYFFKEKRRLDKGINPLEVINGKDSIPTEKIEDKEFEIEKAKDINQKIETQYKDYYGDTIYYKKEAQNFYGNRKSLNEIQKVYGSIQGIQLKLCASYSIKDKLYLIIELSNENSFPFNIKNFKFLYTQNAGYNQESISESDIEPLYEYNSIYQTLLPKKKLTKVFVFEKIGLVENTSLLIQMTDRESEQVFSLKIPSRYIINPKVKAKGYDKETKEKIKEAQKKETKEIDEKY